MTIRFPTPVPFLPILTLALVACSATTTTSPESSGDLELPPQERIPSPSTGGSTSPGSPGGSSNAATGGGTVEPGPGAPSSGDSYAFPDWKREDVQPKSSGFGTTYGLEAYRGKTVVVVLLEGFCPFCQSNSVVAQDLQNTFDSEGLDVQIAVLGDANASQFASRVALPIFRDNDGQAWKTMRANASKHDTFVFGPNGLRTYFWPGSYQGDAARWRVDIGQAVRSVAKSK